MTTAELMRIKSEEGLNNTRQKVIAAIEEHMKDAASTGSKHITYSSRGDVPNIVERYLFNDLVYYKNYLDSKGYNVITSYGNYTTTVKISWYDA